MCCQSLHVVYLKRNVKNGKIEILCNPWFTSIGSKRLFNQVLLAGAGRTHL